MAQVKIYGFRSHLEKHGPQLSELIHACLAEHLQLPREKRFHRLFPMEPEHFLVPPDKTELYTIVEIVLFSGRAQATKKAAVRSLFEHCASELDYAPGDLEIVFLESPRENWGIRGVPADELDLPYKVDV